MKARKTLVYTLKVLGVVAVVLLLATIIISNSSYVQNKIIGLATDAIKKELNAEVQIGHVDINLFGQRASVSDVVLKDQQNRDMLSVKEIWGNLCLLPLLRGRVVLKEFSVSDVDVLVVQPEEDLRIISLSSMPPRKTRKRKKVLSFNWT